jgi:hypothetical protein
MLSVSMMSVVMLGVAVKLSVPSCHYTELNVMAPMKQ